MPEVKCSVSDCTYWESKNNCKADAIMIEIDKHSDAKFKAEFAGESFDTEHRDKAYKSSNTCCHTYRPRNG